MKHFIDKDEDIPAYDLSTKLFDVIGLEKSAMQKVHTLYSEDDPEYSDVMWNVEYDMLYGKRYMYPDGWPYEPTDMQYGVEPIYITDIKEGDYQKLSDNPEKAPEQLHGYYIKGENFNECSFVWINNGFKKETIYIDRNTLFIPDITFDDGEEVYVAQVGDDSIDIGKSEAFIYQVPVAEN